MVRLAQTPIFADTALPYIIGTVTLTDVRADFATSIAPYRGKGEAVQLALHRAIGAGLPAAGRVERGSRQRSIWAGPGRALIIGAALPATLLAELRPLAAVTDQSGAQAMLGLTGAASEAVLARMVAVDLRPAAFAIGQVALCDIGHMPGMVLRTCTQSYELMVMRSMAATLLHEVCDAAKRVAASADGG